MHNADHIKKIFQNSYKMGHPRYHTEIILINTPLRYNSALGHVPLEQRQRPNSLSDGLIMKVEGQEGAL